MSHLVPPLLDNRPDYVRPTDCYWLKADAAHALQIGGLVDVELDLVASARG